VQGGTKTRVAARESTTGEEKGGEAEKKKVGLKLNISYYLAGEGGKCYFEGKLRS